MNGNNKAKRHLTLTFLINIDTWFRGTIITNGTPSVGTRAHLLLFAITKIYRAGGDEKPYDDIGKKLSYIRSAMKVHNRPILKKFEPIFSHPRIYTSIAPRIVPTLYYWNGAFKRCANRMIGIEHKRDSVKISYYDAAIMQVRLCMPGAVAI